MENKAVIFTRRVFVNIIDFNRINLVNDNLF
jgi:hypothetical protein